MTQRHWFGWCGQYTWVGAIASGTALCAIASTVYQTFAYYSPALAQSNIVPDNTLGAESSVVTPNAQGLPRVEITGGAVRGANLFHSFQEFNVDAGRSAYFNADAGIQNILARVTGTTKSEIFGTLGTIGSAANLFLINPNGIIFGPNASLDVRGSFVASTANAIQFGEQGFFSATNPTSNTPLLTVNPSALFFNQIAAPIQNNSVAPAGIAPAGFGAIGLRVPDGKSLLLIGGNINMDRGQLNAYGGRVELSGLAGSGTVALNVDGNNLSAGFPNDVPYADVLLTNGAGVYVEALGGGSITVNAQNLDITSGSILRAGIGQGLGTVGTVAGDVVLNAKGEIVVDTGSIVDNIVGLGSKGNGGNITINSGSFSLLDGARLQTSTFGQGNAGNVTVRALGAVSLADASIFSTVEAGGFGKGGDIDINAATLSLIDGAQLQTLTRSASATAPAGRGDAGNVNVNVIGSVNLAGEKNGFPSAIGSLVQTGSVGNGGNITINSGSFELQNGAQLEASTFGQGNAGNVTVRALGAVSLADASIFSTVSAGGVGKGGDIDISGATLSLIDSAQLLTLTRSASATGSAGQGNAGNVNVNVSGAVNIAGEKNGLRSAILSSVETGTVGNGGNITINSGSFELQNGALLSASTFGQGNAGNVTVRATDAVSLADASIFSTVSAGGVGKGGDIDINAATLSLIDGAQLLTFTSSASATAPAGRGDAGNVNVNVSGAVNIAGEKNGLRSAILSSVETGTVGNGGNITINSGSFSLQDGAGLSASTFGQGNAGNVTVRALGAVSLAFAPIFSTVSAGGVGKGGDIDISGATLSLIDGAQLLTFTSSASATGPAGRGDAGNVNVNVIGSVNLAGEKNGFPSGIGSSVETGSVGNGGNITINSGSFELQNGAELSASTFGQGNAGNVTVRALGAVSLADASIFSTVEAGGVGKGGDIDINAATLSLIDGAQLQTLTRSASATGPAGRGDAGNVNVNVTGAVSLTGEKNGLFSGIGSLVQTGSVGNGGNITINSGSFSLQNGARLEASTFGQGKAGNVTVRATDAVSLADASIFSTVEAGGVGKGGDIDINAATLSLIDSAQLLTITSSASATAPAGRGDAGNVNVNVIGAVNLAGEKNGLPSAILSSVETGTVGNGGNITINSGSFSLRDGAGLSASTLGQGNAGTIKVNAAAKVNISGFSSNFNSGLFVNSQSTTGIAGDIIVTAPQILLNNTATINAESASGNGGNINLQTDLLLLRRGAQISTTAGTAQAGGDGGNITINAPNGFIVAVPRENSDISANAYTGRGGTVQIDAFGIYGTQFRATQNPLTSDITASSTLGVAGTININTPNTDALQNSLTQLPENIIDANALIANSCIARRYNQSSGTFLITGNGGLPQRPGDAPLSPYPTGTIRSVSTERELSFGGDSKRDRPNLKISAPIVEAQGIYRLANGDLVLSRECP